MSVPSTSVYGILSGSLTHRNPFPQGALFLPYADSQNTSTFQTLNADIVNVSTIVGLDGTNVTINDNLIVGGITMNGNISLTGNGSAIYVNNQTALSMPFSTLNTPDRNHMEVGSAVLNAGGSTIVTCAVPYNATANFVPIAAYRDAVTHLLDCQTSNLSPSTFLIVADANGLVNYQVFGYN